MFVKTRYAYFPHSEHEISVSSLAMARAAVPIVPLSPSSQEQPLVHDGERCRSMDAGEGIAQLSIL